MNSYKVDICGINTSKLTVLSAAEKRELLEKAQAGDADARDRLIRGNMKLVLSVVQRFTGRKEELDDLFQIGCIGLIKAIDHFDLSQNVQLSTYAVPMIIGEIRRYLRDNNSIRVSRSLRDIAYKALQARERLSARGISDPTTEQLAREIGLPKEQVVMALDAIMDPISLYEPIYNEGSDAIYVMDQVGDSRNTDSNWIEEIALKEAIRGLGEREKKILSLRFFMGKTQVEVAREIGISQAQVSRLEKGALDKIKGKI